MKDETYLYISDVKDKKRTARGAHAAARQALGVPAMPRGTRVSAGWKDFLRGAPCRGEEAADDTADDSKRCEASPAEELPAEGSSIREWAEALNCRCRELERENAILLAKLEVVQMIFGGGR